MSESEPHEGYRISRTLESIDREIRRQIRRHARGEERSPFEPGIERNAGGADVGSNEGRLNGRLARTRLYENTPISTHARLLLSDGIALPSPEKLGNGEEIQAKLWEVINALAARRVYIRHTNHLTDRELYSALWTVHLNEVTRDLSECVGCACHIDLLHCRAAEDREGRGRHEAEPTQRKHWLRERLAEILSDRRELPYNRDQCLPKQGPW